LAYVRENVSGKRWADRAQGRDDGSLTQAVVRALFSAATKCPYCWQPMRSKDKSLDHKQPLSRGGWHSVTNVIVCCLRCNSRKHGRPWTEWLAMIPAPCASALSANQP
jgi:5-methylcytosine-specific restriction endonuclease McrA